MIGHDHQIAEVSDGDAAVPDRRGPFDVAHVPVEADGFPAISGHHRGVEALERLLAQQAVAVCVGPRPLEPAPREQVLHRGDEAGSGPVGGSHLPTGLPPAGADDVGGALEDPVGGQDGVGDGVVGVEGGGVHAQGHEQAIVHEAVERLSRNRLDDRTGDREAGVAVAEPVPRREQAPGIGQGAEVVGATDEEVVTVETALVAQDVLDGDLVERQTRRRSEVGQVAGHRILEGDVSLLDQQRHGCAGEGLGDRRHLRQRPRGDG